MSEEINNAFNHLREAIQNRVNFFHRDLIDYIHQPYDKDHQSTIASIATGGYRNNIDLRRNPTKDPSSPEITLSEHEHEPRYFKLITMEAYAKLVTLSPEQERKLARHANPEGKLFVETDRYGKHPGDAGKKDLSLSQLLFEIVIDKTSQEYHHSPRASSNTENTEASLRDTLLDIAARYHPDFIKELN